MTQSFETNVIMMPSVKKPERATLASVRAKFPASELKPRGMAAFYAVLFGVFFIIVGCLWAANSL